VMLWLINSSYLQEFQRFFILREIRSVSTSNLCCKGTVYKNNVPCVGNLVDSFLERDTFNILQLLAALKVIESTNCQGNYLIDLIKLLDAFHRCWRWILYYMQTFLMRIKECICHVPFQNL
jgi:hypothetical protein